MSDDAAWLNGLLAGKATPAAPTSALRPAPVVPPGTVPAPDDGVPVIWQVGDLIADLYQVQQVLGEGGMGVVHKVRHRAWDIELAAKSPRRAQLTRAGTDNFVRECETWVQLGLHPHVVSCHYVRVMGGLPRVFAEYVAGGSLSDWIATRRLYEGGPQEALARVLDIAIQFAWGLDFAHEQGLVHQDVKPANVMMTPKGVAKITDFGLARARATLPGAAGGAGAHAMPAAAGKTVFVATGGMTPAYCSPEQSAGQPVSRRTDTWSFGLSVLEMFTGGVSWMAGQLAAQVLRDFVDTPPDEADLPPMPDAVAALLRRCFAQHPKDRPARMSELADELIGIYRQATSQPYERAAPRPVESRASSLNNRALSQLDLGRRELAEQSWKDALALDPLHLEAVYNHGLLQWREGRLTDEKLVARLAASCATIPDARHEWLPAYLMACVHLERGDPAAAGQLLWDLPAPVPAEVEAARRGLQRYHRADRTPDIDLSGNTDASTVDDPDIAAQVCLTMLDRAAGTVVSANGSRLLTLATHDERDWVSLQDTGSGRRWTTEIARTGRTRDPLRAGIQPPGSRVALSADGSVVLAYPERSQVVVIDGTSGRQLRILEGIDMNVLSAGLSEDGRLAAVVLGIAGASKIGVWDVVSGRNVGTFERHSGGAPLARMLTVAVHAKAGIALSGDADSTLRLWQLDGGRFVRTFEGHSGRVHAVSLGGDGSCAASLGEDRTLRLWDIASGRCRRTMSNDAPTALLARSRPAPLRVAPVSATETQQSRSSAARGWLAQAEQALQSRRASEALARLRQVRETPGWERDAGVLAAWRKAAALCRNTRLRGAWPLQIAGGPLPPLSSAALTPDGQTALAGGADGVVRIYDFAAGTVRATLYGHRSAVQCIAISRDGSLGLASSVESVRLWDLTRQRELRTFDTGHSAVPGDRAALVHLDAGGRLVATAMYSKVTIWDAATGVRLRTLDVGSAPSICALRFSDDARLVIAADADDEVRVWDVASGRCLHVLRPAGAFDPAADDRLRADKSFERLLSREGMRSIDLSADQRTMVYGSPCRPPRWIDLASGRTATHLPGTGHFLGAAGGDARLWLAHTIADETTAERGLKQRALRLWDSASGELLHAFEPAAVRALGITLSCDSSTALVCLEDAPAQFWHLDWELEPAIAGDGETSVLLRPHLEAFLRLHTPWPQPPEPGAVLDEAAVTAYLTPGGQPRWTEAAFDELLATLGRVGAGHIPHERVRAELDARGAASAAGGPGQPRS